MKKPNRRNAANMLLGHPAASPRRILGLAGLSVVLGAASLQAQEWKGTTSSAWTDASNWDPAAVPTAGNTFINIVGNPGGPSPFTAVISSSVTAGEIKIGFADTTGRLDHTAGVVTGNGWQFVGGEGTGSGVGTYNIADTTGSGGTLTGYAQGSGGITSARMYVGYQPSDGTLNVNTTGTIAMGEELNVGDGQFAAADTFGTANVDAGTITAPTVNVGHQAFGNGVLNFGGGTMTTDLMRIGAASGIGDVVMSGGIVNAGEVLVGQGGGFGPLALDGGTLNATIIGGDGDISFNGTQINATADGTAFLDGIGIGTIEAGHLLVNTAGFNVSGNLFIEGTGGVTKSGAGTLSLLGDSDYAGDNVVSEGTLVVAANDSTLATGDFTIAASAGLGVTTPDVDEQIFPANLTFTGAGTLDFDFGDVAGFNPANAPLDVTTNLALGGVVTVNVSGSLFTTGTFPLVTYAAKTGAGSVTLGTLPLGVQATLNDTGSVIELTITSVSLPEWNGDVSNFWDTTTLNWIDQISTSASLFSDGDPVLFSDTAVNNTVTLNTTVMPSSVEFDNSVAYTLGGSGKINGSTGLTKDGTGSLTITGLANDYTGVTALNGGTTSIDTLTDGGVASSIGAATSAAANLLFNGGTLEYTGASTSTNRGYTVAGVGSVFSHASDVTLTSNDFNVLASAQLAKAGAGTLTFSNAGALPLGAGGTAFSANGGTTIFTGSTTQVVTAGDLHVNREVDATSTLELTNTTVNVTRFRTGDDDGSDLFTSSATINQTDSDVVVSDQTHLSLGSNSTTIWNLNGTSDLNTVGPLRVGGDVPGDAGAVASIILNDTASITANSWITIGENGNGTSSGTLTLNDSSSITQPNLDFNVGDTADGVGILNVNDSATISTLGQMFIGKNSATGTVNVTGGTVTAGNWVNIAGVGEFSTGTLNVSGGTFDHSATEEAGSNINVGDNGDGTATVSGTGTIKSAVGINVANNPTAFGTLNIGSGGVGGTVITPYVRGGTGSSEVIFDGGTLQAAADDGNFLAADIVDIEANGATINTDTFTVTSSADIGGIAGGDLTKTGTGTLILSGFNSYDGNTTVSAGCLSLDYIGANPDLTKVTVASGAGFGGIVGVSNLSDTDIVSIAADTNWDVGGGSFLVIDTNGANVVVAANIAGNFGLIKKGDGELTLSGTNTFTGPTVIQGGSIAGPVTEIVISSITRTGTSATLTFTSPGNVDVYRAADLQSWGTALATDEPSPYTDTTATGLENYYILVPTGETLPLP